MDRGWCSNYMTRTHRLCHCLFLPTMPAGQHRPCGGGGRGATPAGHVRRPEAAGGAARGCAGQAAGAGVGGKVWEGRWRWKGSGKSSAGGPPTWGRARSLGLQQLWSVHYNAGGGAVLLS